VRINRYLSQCGLGSRRKVEHLVREGRVRVNGEVCRDLATVVEPDRDRVEVDGHTLVRADPPGRILLYHKPLNVVCSFRRQGRVRCLADVLPDALQQGRLFHVGRLDRDSTGLLLLTDDGDLTQRLLHPSHPVWKAYEVTSDLELAREDLRAFREGEIELDGRPCRPCRIEPRGTTGDAFLYSLELQEGRKRQIRRMFGALGGRILRLHRVAFGPVALGALEVGAVRPAHPQEIQALRSAAGMPPRAIVDEGEDDH
jgi:23S rRNA pseudouridine2605 synthase